MKKLFAAVAALLFAASVFAATAEEVAAATGAVVIFTKCAGSPDQMKSALLVSKNGEYAFVPYDEAMKDPFFQKIMEIATKAGIVSRVTVRGDCGTKS